MALTVTSTKSCCGSRSSIISLPIAIKKNHAQAFKSRGYICPDNFYNVGVFYVYKSGSGNVTVTGSFGSTKLSVRCKGQDCEKNLEKFVRELEEVLGLT